MMLRLAIPFAAAAVLFAGAASAAPIANTDDARASRASEVAGYPVATYRMRNVGALEVRPEASPARTFDALASNSDDARGIGGRSVLRSTPSQVKIAAPAKPACCPQG